MKKYQIVFLILALFTVAFIFYNSSLEQPYNPYPQENIVPVIYHFGIFFLLSLFLFLAGRMNKEFLFIVLLISFAYAALDEIHQYFVFGRGCSLFDFGIDGLGILLSFVIVLFVIRRMVSIDS